MLEPQDIAALRETAETATPGVWRAAEGDLEGKPMLEYFRTLLGNREKDGTSIERLFLVLAPNDIDPEVGAEVIPATTGDGPRAEANAAFIAAMSPAVVLALLSEVERGRALRAAVEALVPALIETDPDGMIRHSNGFSHTSAMQCGDCPGYPHANCVDASELRNLLSAHVPSPLLDGGAGEGDR